MELSQEMRDFVIELAVAGESMTKICETIGCTRFAMYRYREKYPDFDRSITRAQMDGVEAQTDRLLTAHTDFTDPQKARVMSDNVKWLAARRKPEVYGDRLDLNVTERVDVNGALLEARKRSSVPICDQSEHGDTQDAEYTVISDGRARGCEPQDSEPGEDDGVDIFS